MEKKPVTKPVEPVVEASIEPVVEPVVEITQAPIVEPVVEPIADDNDMTRMHMEAMRAAGVPFCDLCGQRVLVGLGNVKICQDLSKKDCPITIEQKEREAAAEIEIASASVAMLEEKLTKAEEMVAVTKDHLLTVEKEKTSFSKDLALAKSRLEKALSA